MAKKFSETTYLDAAPRVDADKGILYGVKVLGESSRNKRRYTGLREAASKYEGVKSYIDHPDRDSSGERRFGDWSGVFHNPRYEEGKGIFADLHLRTTGAHFQGILEAAQKFPNAVGFSHVAEGESHFDGDTEIVESIKSVFSVDLVTDPATTAGFFESVQPDAIREAVEQLPESNELRKRFSEMVDAGYFGGMDAGKEQPTDALSQLTSVLRDTIAALADSLKALAKANRPAPAPAPAEVPPTEEAEDDPEDEEMTDEDKQKISAFESMERENAELKASKLLLESGRLATPVRMKALANCTNEDEQRELLESWPKAEENGRPARSPGLVESASDFPRDNPEKFAALLR